MPMITNLIGWPATLALLAAVAIVGVLAVRKPDMLPGQLRRFLRIGTQPDGTAPAAIVADAVSTRGIPSVMEDPALGVAPEPAELVGGNASAPGPCAALAAYIAGFEPEDDMALRVFVEGLAAGSVMIADAWNQFAETCLSTVGLDPAFVAGILEAGDSAAAHGSLLAQVIKRLSVIYGAIQEWVAAHGPLPHKAREFLTGDL
jgi:hypothetical protein